MCAMFFAHICTISLKLCVEPVVCARRLRILRALIAFSCRQQLFKYRLFTTKLSCFFNAFLTHLRDLFLNRAWSLSAALGDREYFVLSSPSLAVWIIPPNFTPLRRAVFVCVPHTIAKTLQAGSSAAFEASSCQQFQPLHLLSSAPISIIFFGIWGSFFIIDYPHPYPKNTLIMPKNLRPWKKGIFLAYFFKSFYGPLEWFMEDLAY